LSIEGEKIGQLTSGAPSPSMGNTGVGIGYISGVMEGDEVLIAASPRSSVRAVIIRPPFV
jgi:glycine cleavage system aminomethyltransferase T